MPARHARQRLLSGSYPSARSFAPRFLPTLGHPHAVALHFVRRDQLTVGLPPVVRVEEPRKFEGYYAVLR